MPRTEKQKATERALSEARRLLERYERSYEALGFMFDPDDWDRMTGGLTAANKKWRADLSTYRQPRASSAGRPTPLEGATP